MISQNIGFIGAGQMAQALAKGFVAAGCAAADRIFAFDPAEGACRAFAAVTPEAAVCKDNSEVVEKAEIVFLAVKPQYMGEVLQDIRGAVSKEKLIVSIAAGITILTLEAGLKSQRIVRVMPNTPCLIGKGASGYARGPGASDQDAALVQELLSAVGLAVEVAEPLLDAVTGLSGSGPAYAFVILEALADAGVRMGLPRATAASLAVQTLEGAAALVRETGEHPAVLKDRVASPGGTTIAGLAELENRGLRSALIAAVEAATLKSRELGK